MKKVNLELQKKEGERRKALLLLVQIAVRYSGNGAAEGERELRVFSCSFLCGGFLGYGLFDLFGTGNLNLPGGGNADADGPFSGFQNRYLDIVPDLNGFVDFAG